MDRSRRGTRTRVGNESILRESTENFCRYGWQPVNLDSPMHKHRSTGSWHTLAAGLRELYSAGKGLSLHADDNCRCDLGCTFTGAETIRATYSRIVSNDIISITYVSNLSIKKTCYLKKLRIDLRHVGLIIGQ